jgi:mono/diheme cytochrome c family protein
MNTYSFSSGLLLVMASLLAAFSFSCTSSPYRQGEALYGIYCANCHMQNGEGLAELYPPLAGANYLSAQDGNLACLIRNGISGPMVVNARQFDMQMPGVPSLTSVEITNIINFIHHAWGNELRTVTLDEVSEQLRQCEKK